MSQRGRESGERLRLAAKGAHMGTWDRDFRTNRIVWSEEQERLMGYEPGTFPGTYEAFYELVHPEDRGHLAEAQRRAQMEGGTYRAELRFLLRDGRVRWGLVIGQMRRAGPSAWWAWNWTSPTANRRRRKRG